MIWLNPLTTDVGMAVVLPEGFRFHSARYAIGHVTVNVRLGQSFLLVSKLSTLRTRKAERQFDEDGGALSGSTLTAAIEAATEQSAAIR